MRAEVVESPLDVSSSMQVQGKLTAGQEPRMDARFVLRLVRERPAA
jgi:hypothetical protein